MTRSGFVALAGRPNVGKSTLVNAVVGEKVAIVSDRPQTTRRAIRGSAPAAATAQLVLVDLPGVQRPRDALTARMARRVQHELEGADAALLMLNGEQGVGPGDRFIARHAGGQRHAGDDRGQQGRPPRRAARSWPCSSRPPSSSSARRCSRSPRARGDGRRRARRAPRRADARGAVHVRRRGEVSDQPRELLLAELIREAVIRRTFQELPHAVEVVVEEIERPRAGLARVRALIWVESESQKAILVGARGRMIKAIGTAARRELQRELDCQVHLDLSVRVRRDWRADEELLDRLGIT